MTAPRFLILFKRRVWPVCVLAACFSLAGLSATCPAGAAPQDPPAPGTIRVDPAACRWLARYQPDPGVAYQPGVDVDGNPVVPADLNPVPPGAGQGPLLIPITGRLSQLLGRAGGAGGRYGRGARADQVILGLITVDGDRVLFNGQPLDDEADAELAALCQRQGH